MAETSFDAVAGALNSNLNQHLYFSGTGGENMVPINNNAKRITLLNTNVTAASSNVYIWDPLTNTMIQQLSIGTPYLVSNNTPIIFRIDYAAQDAHKYFEVEIEF